MTDHEIARVGAAFGSYLRLYQPCFLQERTATHFDNYCRGLLSDLPRKTLEPIALRCGTAVRTLQEFLTTAVWNHEQARDLLQHRLGQQLAQLPADPLGTIGVIDETSCRKKGDRTPGVQRQYLGCVGKVDNGLVTVHLGLCHGRFQALADATLFLPESWADDRPRCQAAGIPDTVSYYPKWRLALDQYVRLRHHGVHFDWLTFDEGYGSKVPFLTWLSRWEQPFVAEVPVSFSVRVLAHDTPQRADVVLTAQVARQGQRIRIRRQTGVAQWWRSVSLPVRVDDRDYVLVVAINEATAEVKYFLSNASSTPLTQLLGVGCRRATVEHTFQLGKQEAGLLQYEGRPYVGLVRHLIVVLIVMGFVSLPTERLRGKKSSAHPRASLPRLKRPLRRVVPPTTRHSGRAARRPRHPLPPTTQRSSDPLPQATSS